MGIAADAAGFDTYWAPEHHCLEIEEYSHGSSSHLACLAVGVQTKRIRVVTGIFNRRHLEGGIARKGPSLLSGHSGSRRRADSTFRQGTASNTYSRLAASSTEAADAGT